MIGMTGESAVRVCLMIEMTVNAGAASTGCIGSTSDRGRRPRLQAASHDFGSSHNSTDLLRMVTGWLYSSSRSFALSFVSKRM